jgi:hypothetical protein
MSLAALARSNQSAPQSMPLESERLNPSSPSGFEMLTRYIPTETITLYVGAMAARDEIAKLLGLPDAIWPIYWVFAFLTPILLLLLTLGANRRAGAASAGPIHWWPLFASFLAFLVWAMSVPGHPIAEQLKALPAFAALFLSVFLSLLDPVLGPGKG